jgi:polyisoprenoid-binding protein YceI
VTLVSRVQGKVATADGWPVPGAVVTVIGAAGRQLGRGASDENGAFGVPVGADGPVTVIIAAAGVDPVARAATAGSNGHTELGIVVLDRARRTDLPAPGLWRLDPAHSILRATARHLALSRVEGRFMAYSGDITVADPVEDSSARVTISASSIETGSDDRDAHLRSSDFLDVEQFPFLTFRSSRFSPQTAERWLVDGVLTIRDRSRKVVLDLKYLGTSGDPWGGTRMAFTATATLPLHDYGIHWNMALPDGLSVIGPSLRIHLDVEAVLDQGAVPEPSG